MHVYIIFIDSPGKGLWVIAEFVMLMNSGRGIALWLCLLEEQPASIVNCLPLNLEKPEVLYRWHTDSVELKL